MRIDREYFIRFAVAVALACYDLPTDRAMTSEEAAQLVKWVIDMALGPDASNVQVEPMENYPASSKMPLIISMAGVQQHLFWFYPQQSFEEMCDALSAMLGEIPISCDSIPACWEAVHMRTSHRQIRKRILDAKSKITDEEFFSSRAYNGYLTDLAEAATKRYKRPLRVRVVADHDDETVAFTDYHGIYINACNHITWSFPSRLLRSMSLEGLNAHECGHNLFTDERIWHSYFAGLAKGKFYPKMPDGLDSMQKLYAKDILEALTDDTDTVPMQVIMSTAHALSNILEDGYVDARYSYEFPGSPAKGIALNNLRYADTMPEITEMINRKYYDHSIVVNLLIQYVRAHEVNNLSGYTGEFIDKLYEYIPWIDESVYDDDARSRCEAANRILVDLWPMMQRCFDALRDKQKQAQQQAKQSSQQTGKGGSGSGSGQPGSGDDDNDGSQQGQQAVEEDLSSQLPKAAANFTIKTKPVPSNGTFTPNPGQMNAIRAQVERVIAEETSRIAAHLTNGITSSGNGGVDQNSEYEGNDYEHAADDIERLLSSMAEEKVTEELEEELSEELQREANAIRYGNAHRNIHVTVNRMAHVDQNLIDSYNRVAPELLMLSKRLQRSVSSALRDRRQGGKQTGLLIGKRLNQHALYRNDGRIFYNSRLPTEPINLSVGLLIDESGSMCSNDRITRARATAIVIQDFCESLGIPLLVVGHTAWSSHVELFSYSDFDTYDKNNRYRLMDMSARDCNRDGAALRFVAEKLSKQTSEVKILMIICDGQPNDDGYSGSAAEADLRGIKLEYARKGVKIYAAAIGEDRPRIERIYGDGYLDITNLQELPVMLTNLIVRSLPH